MDTFLLDSELNFRDYITKNINKIMKIIIFEDDLDNIIYFYCFCSKYILATKENNKDFNYFLKIYKELNNNLNFKTIIENKKVLKLIK